MDTGRFRAVAERMDALLADRLGDRALLVGTTRILKGTFSAPFQGAEIGGKTKGFTLGGPGAAVVDTADYGEPAFQLVATDAQGIERGAVLDVQLPAALGGGRYDVLRLKADGAGMVDLVLRAKSDDRAANPA